MVDGLLPKNRLAHKYSLKMFRPFLLCLVWFSIADSLESSDGFPTVPDCEKKSPDDVSFDLSNNSLTTIDKSLAFGASVKCINLEGNHITDLQKDAFSNVPELTYLNLARNPVSFDGFMNLSFPKLETLVLDGPFDDDNCVHDPMSVCHTGETVYDLENKEWLTRYGARPLELVRAMELSNLKVLSLRNYGDRRVEKWFEHLIVPRLNRLYIAGNGITNMYIGDKFTQALTHLNIDDNKIIFFVTNYTKLQYLSMDDNRIENVCSVNCRWYFLSLYKTYDLKYLSLRRNNISFIDSDAFVHTSNLSILNLDFNKLSSLPRDVFNNTPGLKNLSLSDNSLTEVPYICELRQLEFLILSGNQIGPIDDLSFCNLPNLKFIGLSRSTLVTVSDRTFSQLPALKAIDLSWNSIKVLPENWIETRSDPLKFVNLIGNDFTNVANISVPTKKTFDVVCLAYNPMTITPGEVIDLPPTFKIGMSGTCEL